MVPHVALGMPLRILAASDEPLQLGEVAHPSGLAQEGKTMPDLDALDEQLGPFLEEPFGRKVLDRHRAAYLHRLLRRLQVEAGDELHSAQDAQRILHELRRHVAQHPPPHVLQSAERILELVRQGIVVHGVDGEVAPACRLVDREIRVGIDKEALVPNAALRLAPRQRHVDVEVLYLQYAEGEPACVEVEARAYDALKPLRVEAIHLQINVLHASGAHQ